MRFLFLFFVLLPIVEITVLIKVGSIIGLAPTVALVLLTAFLGAYFLRQQGLHTLFRINQRMAAGEVPARELLEGVLIAVGGALLLTPGFVTDAMGFACVLPGSRHFLVALLLNRAIVTSRGGPQSFGRPQDPFQPRPSGTESAHSSASGSHPPVTIEGEYRRED